MILFEIEEKLIIQCTWDFIITVSYTRAEDQK